MDAKLTMYEANKNIYAQLPPLTKEQIQRGINEVLAPYINAGGDYFMLLCREYNYYTLYHLSHRLLHANIGLKTAEDIVDLVKTDLGCIYDITKNEDDVVEIWVKNYDDHEMHAYFFFPYDRGVIEI